MFKDNYFAIADDRLGFEIVGEIDSMGIPEGVTPDMLWDIWDITAKFGQLDRLGEINRERISFFHPPLFMEIFDRRTIQLDGKIRIFITQSQETTVLKETIYKFILKNGAEVLWDKGLSVEMYQEFVGQIDKRARGLGFLKDKDRFDLRLLSSHKQYLEVSKLFSQPQSFLIVLADEVEIIKGNLDHPELAIALEYDTVFCLCLKSNQAIMQAAIEKSSANFKITNSTKILSRDDYKTELKINLNQIPQN